MRYKQFYGLKLSEIGIGTYLGASDDNTDFLYEETILAGINKGITVIDTAINYRKMRSEQVIGKVLKKLDRKEVVLSTKGGYITPPPKTEKDPTQWFKEELVEKGIVQISDITETGNILTTKYISWSFERSLKNLNTDYIDIYFLHNPEDQLTKFSKDIFYNKLEEVFLFLEKKVNEGKLKFYGLATWNGFRVDRNHTQFLDLVEIFRIAEKAGGNNHHFRFIQLPYNLAMLEGFLLKNQLIDGEKLSTFEAAEKLGIYTYISAPLMQGRLLRPVSEEVIHRFKVKKTSHVPLQFVRSTPGVGTVLIGMSKKEHLLENLEIEEVPPLSSEEINQIISSKG